ncbi:UNVERIFIED_CONTAM: Vesicle-associated membrane protein [Sesamum radiatum]|uniref:Vesicle-associated membrane protein n=1 Tax=Sesamum radiatum TaxID=300843 RepID=A0AAW2W4H0_SESRA
MYIYKRRRPPPTWAAKPSPPRLGDVAVACAQAGDDDVAQIQGDFAPNPRFWATEVTSVAQSSSPSATRRRRRRSVVARGMLLLAEFSAVTGNTGHIAETESAASSFCFCEDGCIFHIGRMPDGHMFLCLTNDTFGRKPYTPQP